MDTPEVDFPMFRLRSKHTGPIVVDVLYVGVDGIVVSMAVDTGASLVGGQSFTSWTCHRPVSSCCLMMFQKIWSPPICILAFIATHD